MAVPHRPGSRLRIPLDLCLALRRRGGSCPLRSLEVPGVALLRLSLMHGLLPVNGLISVEREHPCYIPCPLRCADLAGVPSGSHHSGHLLLDLGRVLQCLLDGVVALLRLGAGDAIAEVARTVWRDVTAAHDTPLIVHHRLAVHANAVRLALLLLLVLPLGKQRDLVPMCQVRFSGAMVGGTCGVRRSRRDARYEQCGAPHFSPASPRKADTWPCAMRQLQRRQD